MPTKHARLSPSSAHRWMHCPPSVVLSEQLSAAYPEVAAAAEASSPYAEEGTAAHALAELFAMHKLGWLTDDALAELLMDWEVEFDQDQTSEGFEEMSRCCWEYADFIHSVAGQRGQVFLEQRVDPKIPECYGTSDAIIVGMNKHLQILDYKHGAGILVSAVNNPQLQAYALGALEDFGDIFDDIEHVTMTVFQPRLDNVSSYTLSVDELYAWREQAVAAAQLAAAGEGEFAPSESTCQFCPAKGLCRARMEASTAVDFGVSADLLSPAELAQLLPELSAMSKWIEDMREAAFDLAFRRGVKIPGFRVGASTTRRYITDSAGLVDLLSTEYGVDAAEAYDVKTKPLGWFEKKLGKKAFAEIAAPYLAKTEPKPKLVPIDDPSPDWMADFEAVEDA